MGSLRFSPGTWLAVLASAGTALAAAWYTRAPVPTAPCSLEQGIACPEILDEWLIPQRQAEPLTDELRRRGFNECNPQDPLGLGPYRPYTRLPLGRLTIPQRGGHTADFGYDVLVHFHGHDAMRKFLVQVSRGIAYVGVDLGLGSGPYATEFSAADSFDRFRAAIERGLKKASGDDRAHIRHLALAAWSAGYGAVNEILKHGDEGIDAVVLLDGLHARFDPASAPTRKGRRVLADFIEPTFQFAERAARGEKLFVFTHSEVDPRSYPSTRATARALLERLELEPRPVAGTDPFGVRSEASRQGLHVWGTAGRDEHAHCAHLALIARVLGEVLEPTWHTPVMDSDVEPTPAPKLGGPTPPADDRDVPAPAEDPQQATSTGPTAWLATTSTPGEPQATERTHERHQPASH